ncbi:hypothetical protein Pla52n_15710 [Stieleria varia]|uniref:Uncharacterized protein n=1 Tax=Stieleria varia TaxID=2528005 RepID=A0A5C6B3K6_9BACT|nr:hypothetical protein Pla52n_15710 [Stieleria varia]
MAMSNRQHGNAGRETADRVEFYCLLINCVAESSANAELLRKEEPSTHRQLLILCNGNLEFLREDIEFMHQDWRHLSLRLNGLDDAEMVARRDCFSAASLSKKMCGQKNSCSFWFCIFLSSRWGL